MVVLTVWFATQHKEAQTRGFEIITKSINGGGYWCWQGRWLRIDSGHRFIKQSLRSQNPVKSHLCLQTRSNTSSCQDWYSQLWVSNLIPSFLHNPHISTWLLLLLAHHPTPVICFQIAHPLLSKSFQLLLNHNQRLLNLSQQPLNFCQRS